MAERAGCEAINLLSILIFMRCDIPHERHTVFKLHLDQNFTAVPKVLTDVTEVCDLLKTSIHSQ